MSELFSLCNTIWINADLISFDAGVSTPYGSQRSCAIGVSNGRIAHIAPMSEFDRQALEQIDIIDLEGRWVSPGLIDCHTHLVFAGDRSDDFELMQRGVSYQEILQQGGGIFATVRETRQVSMRQLLDLALPKVKKLMAEGVTRIEIKSGYGLDLDTETKILKVAKAIEKALPISVSTTFLGAHVFPLEYQGREDEYLFVMCQQWIPQLLEAQLIDAVDVFCEPSGFGLSMAKTLFDVAKHRQLKVKMHAEQLSNQHGAALAASYQALSADHLNYLDEPGVKALANNDTVAVLLPLTHYYLQVNQFPPVSLLRDNHVDMAIASDYNAGSSPMLSLLLAANMACIRFGLSAEEALKGITLNAAKALNVEDEEGALVVGKVANMIVWNITAPRDICVQFGLPQIHQRIYKGKITQA